MAHWKDYKEDWILFLESGFIAVNQADEDAAIKLFKAAELLNPDSVMPKVGRGYLHLHKLELKQAVQMFEEVLKKEPKNEMAKSFLGICLSLSPASLDKGEKILEQLHKSHDPLIKNLSTTAIQFAEKFLKKAPTPAQGERKTK
jgi:tetratricopeptide (TPR) repeat protein